MGLEISNHKSIIQKDNTNLFVIQWIIFLSPIAQHLY